LRRVTLVRRRDGETVPLIPRYFDLLLLLLERRNEAVHRHEILERVSRVAQLVTDIALAGGAQNDSIERAHAAIAQIDGATRQNTALVEQLAAAAQSLKSQAEQLNGAMAVFKVAA